MTYHIKVVEYTSNMANPQIKVETIQVAPPADEWRSGLRGSIPVTPTGTPGTSPSTLVNQQLQELRQVLAKAATSQTPLSPEGSLSEESLNACGLLGNSGQK